MINHRMMVSQFLPFFKKAKFVPCRKDISTYLLAVPLSYTFRSKCSVLFVTANQSALPAVLLSQASL